jgi:ATP-binding cassette subfamily C protein
LFVLYALLLINSILETLSIGSISVFLLLLTNSEKILQYSFVKSFLQALNLSESHIFSVGCVLFLAVFVVKNTFSIITYYYQARLTYRLQVKLGHTLFKAYMFAPYTFHLSKNTAVLLRNITRESKIILGQVLRDYCRVCLYSLNVILILTLLFITNFYISLFIMTVIGGSNILFLRIIHGRMEQYGRKAQAQDGQCIKTVNQGLGCIKELKILGRAGYFVDYFNNSLSQYTIAERFRQIAGFLLTPITELLAIISILLIILFFKLLSERMEMLIPTIGLFVASLAKLRTYLTGLINCLANLRYTQVSIEPVSSDLKSLTNLPADTPIGKFHDKLEQFNDKIELQGISYTYPSCYSEVLKNVSFTISKGETVAFAGSTGSGKTTVIDVVLGLLTPQSGEVKVDGKAIDSCISSWHSKIGYVPQFIYLLDDTIRRNIALGIKDEDIVESKLERAIETAQLSDYISGLENGTETIVGEHGVRLSGGQRQRIGIARALYHEPEVLILDEATSALDNITEQQVMCDIEKLKRKLTIIIIAHRLSTIRSCDVIYFMRDGKVIDYGSYDDLYKKNSQFKEMAEINHIKQ